MLVLGRLAPAGADDTGAARKVPFSRVAADERSVNGPDRADGSNRPDTWRYRRHNGRWWYWTTKNSWLYWDNDHWIAHQPATPRPPADDSWRWGWDPANPFDRHPPGRPLNSPKVFPRNM
jgi:hypothetical protein